MVTSSTSSPRLSSYLENKVESYIPKAIALIVFLGGIFLLLAAYQLLPSSPNLISRLDGWGKGLGFVGIAIGGIVFIVMNRKPKAQDPKDPSDVNPPTISADSQQSQKVKPPVGQKTSPQMPSDDLIRKQLEDIGTSLAKLKKDSENASQRLKRILADQEKFSKQLQEAGHLPPPVK